MKKTLMALVLGFAVVTGAHDGPHGPEQKMAPHGGVLRDSETMMFELVKDKEQIKIYTLAHDGKFVDVSQVTVDSKKTTLTDARKKAVQYELIPQGNHMLLKFTKGSSHRYSFNLFAKHEGKENKAAWQIELGAE